MSRSGHEHSNGVPLIRSIGFGCHDADALATFYGDQLGFRRGREILVAGGAYAELVGLPGSRLRLLQLQIGAETLELMQVLEAGPGLRAGRPVPADSRSCDLWFQHICLVTAGMDAVSGPIEAAVRAGALRPISLAPRPCRRGTLLRPAFGPTSSTIPKVTAWSCCSSHRTRVRPAGIRPAALVAAQRTPRTGDRPQRDRRGGHLPQLRVL